MGLNNDILHLPFVIRGKRMDKYNRVYFRSNENLKMIFSKFDVYDKKVFSVLASGDQAFHFLDNGAKKVDVFDKNRLTIYYYYLRRWMIKYFDSFYPNNHFRIDDVKKIIHCESDLEKDALKFWDYFYSNYSNEELMKLFYCFSYSSINEITNIFKLKKRLDEEFNFYNLDVSHDTKKVQDRYDIIYTSNISEYITPNIVSFNLYRDNLDMLLCDGGKIISTCLCCQKISDIEASVFSEKFYIEEIPSDNDIRNMYPSGYIYTKKR